MLICQVVANIGKRWRRCKTIEGQIEFYASILTHQVLQQEKLDIAIEVLKQVKESLMHQKRVVQRTIDA